MDGRAARRFVARHGVVLVSAKGPVPRLTEAIAGEPIRGSWWGHPKGHEIFAVLESVMSSDDVLVCRAVNGRVTLVHRRLWPALVRAARRIGVERVARVEQVHTSSGHHVNVETPMRGWADERTRDAAAALTLHEAIEQLGPWVPGARSRGGGTHGGR